jgi:hypothetical protein
MDLIEGSHSTRTPGLVSTCLQETAFGQTKVTTSDGSRHVEFAVVCTLVLAVTIRISSKSRDLSYSNLLANAESPEEVLSRSTPKLGSLGV